jgi:RND superfamily putative drug exporter
MPLFMFALLFGLSMDYHVFILSRIHELRRRGEPAREAIVGGISASAGVVTSAAAIMVAVFSIFATLSIFEFKVFGIAMSAAILIDATLVRGVLLPAGLSLLGDRAWRVNPLRRPPLGRPPLGRPPLGRPPLGPPRHAHHGPAAPWEMPPAPAPRV